MFLLFSFLCISFQDTKPVCAPTDRSISLMHALALALALALAAAAAAVPKRRRRRWLLLLPGSYIGLGPWPMFDCSCCRCRSRCRCRCRSRCRSRSMPQTFILYTLKFFWNFVLQPQQQPKTAHFKLQRGRQGGGGGRRHRQCDHLPRLG